MTSFSNHIVETRLSFNRESSFNIIKCILVEFLVVFTGVISVGT